MGSNNFNFTQFYIPENTSRLWKVKNKSGSLDSEKTLCNSYTVHELNWLRRSLLVCGLKIHSHYDDLFPCCYSDVYKLTYSTCWVNVGNLVMLSANVYFGYKDIFASVWKNSFWCDMGICAQMRHMLGFCTRHIFADKRNCAWCITEEASSTASHITYCSYLSNMSLLEINIWFWCSTAALPGLCHSHTHTMLFCLLIAVAKIMCGEITGGIFILWETATRLTCRGWAVL